MNPTDITTLPPPPAPDVVERRLSRSPRVWASAVLVVAGLGLIVLGGIFLVGILEVWRMNPAMDPASKGRFESTLYICAYSCFGLALVVLYLGVRGLMRIVREQSPGDVS